jgi:GntR family transcriptional regulator
MINLDYHSRLPIYLQIINEIERYVVLGILKPHDQIPSIRDLASTLGINPNTVRKAYMELENKGVIVTISTKGTFISEEINILTTNKINEYYAIIEKYIAELKKLGVSEKEIIEHIKK